jgi:hypothetical protein
MYIQTMLVSGSDIPDVSVPTDKHVSGYNLYAKITHERSALRCTVLVTTAWRVLKLLLKETTSIYGDYSSAEI